MKIALKGLIYEERRDRVRAALEELPSQMQRCLVLRIDRQLKYHEIAELLQISIDTVKSQLFQARVRIKVYGLAGGPPELLAEYQFSLP